jgi:ATP-dependent 26S proteasome regulatory subunit
MMLSPPMLKAYTPADLKTILTNLGMVAREIRQEQVSQEDVLAVKAKNMKLSRLNQAEIVVRAYCKKKRIAV